MRRNEQEHINYFRNQYDRWSYTVLNFSPKDKRNLFIIVLAVCIFVLLIASSLSSDLGERKQWIWVIILTAFFSILYLLYENYKERGYIPQQQRNIYTDYTQRSHSLFNPKVEESSKRLLRETSEQIESSSKLFGRRPYSFETTSNPKESIITKRRLDSDYKHHEAGTTGRTSQSQGFQQQNVTSGSLSEVFQQYQQPQNLNRTSAGGSRNVREFEIPSTFELPRRSPGRPNYHMSDAGARKSSDYSYSTSPLRGVPGVKGYADKSFSSIPSKGFADEQLLISQRDSGYKRLAENEAESLLTKIGIRSEFPDWKKNCQRWFVAKLIPKILEDNMTNIKELNRIIGYFDKRLHEYEFILKLDQGQRTENISQKSYSPLITIDDLLNYEESVQKGGPLWPSTQLTLPDIARAHQDLSFLMRTRRQLERYFEIEGFRNFEVRLYILERLFKIKENFIANFTYSMDGNKKKYPTDAQILSNLFFTFLNVEAANQTEDKQQIYRNFVFKTNTNIIPPNASNEDVYFRQSTTESYEPHYDIISGKELWTAYPGRDNLFCAICLFIWHIKSKKHGTLGFEDSRAFKEFVQVVVP